MSSRRPRRTKTRAGVSESAEAAVHDRAVSRHSALRNFAAGHRALVSLTGMLGAILLIVYGLLTLRGASVTSGAVEMIAGLALFLLASKTLGATELSKKDLADVIGIGLPVSSVLVGVFLVADAAHQVTLPQTASVGRSAAILWLLGLVAYAAGILWLHRWIPRPAGLIDWARLHGREALLVSIVLILGLVARLYLLSELPYPWSYDETTIGLEGQRILSPSTTNLFDAGWSGNPNLSFSPTALGIVIMGNSIDALRGTSAVLGTLTILFLYLLAREFFDRRTALISAAFMISFPYHLQFSRLGVLTIQDGFMVTLTLWLVARAIRTDRASSYLLAGFASGLNLYAYVGSRLVLALALVVLAATAVRRRDYLRAHVRHLLVYLGATILTLAPMGVFFVEHPQIFNSRLGQVGIIQSGWLAGELHAPGKTIATILLDQVTRSTLVYIATGAYGSFFNSPQPYLSLGAALLFVIGMAVAFQRASRIPSLVLLLWFWSVVVLGGVLTISPPANTRLVMTSPAVAIFVAIGLTTLLDLWGSIGVAKVWLTTSAAVAMSILVIQNTWYYFGPYRAGNYLDDANAEVSMRAGTELQRLGPNFSMYMVGLPRMSAKFPTVPFLMPRASLYDLDAQQAAALDLNGKGPVFVVATPDNEAALADLAQRYPGGTWETTSSQSRNEPLYYGYIFGAPSAEKAP